MFCCINFNFLIVNLTHPWKISKVMIFSAAPKTFVYNISNHCTPFPDIGTKLQYSWQALTFFSFLYSNPQYSHLVLPYT